MKTIAIVVGSYVVGWFLAYILVMGSDFGYVGEYFVLGWSGGLEKPGFINLMALAVTLLTAGVCGVVWWFKKRKTN